MWIVFLSVAFLPDLAKVLALLSSPFTYTTKLIWLLIVLQHTANFIMDLQSCTCDNFVLALVLVQYTHHFTIAHFTKVVNYNAKTMRQ